MAGDFIDSIHQNWATNYNLLEVHHGYIQWLFPIYESGLNGYAQILQRHEAETMKQSKDIMMRVMRSYRLMLGFYGAELDNEETGQLRRASNYRSRFENLNRCRHNYLRITRILKFLGEVGLERLKLPFLTFFIQEALVNRLIPNCRDSLVYFWMPTLREDADLKACIRFLDDPTSWPPASVLLDPLHPPPAIATGQPPPAIATGARPSPPSKARSTKIARGAPGASAARPAAPGPGGTARAGGASLAALQGGGGGGAGPVEVGCQCRVA
jgi:hypothetical protein